MVGPPKTIDDLARLDANPVVSCRQCIWRVEYDRGRLSRLRITAGLGTDWLTFCQEMRCEVCGGPVRVSIKPFVSDTALREGDMKKALVFKALCVLEEAQQAAKVGRVQPSSGLRFALAYLYAVGRREGEWFKREPYVEFWQVATQRYEAANDMGGSARATVLQVNVNAIARAAGMEMTPDVMAALGKTVSGVGQTSPGSSE